MLEWMGTINLTPDSFYEPSRFDSVSAMARIREFVEAGASIIDLGAVSTRPGASPVPLEEEWARLKPVLTALRGTSVPGITVEHRFRISIDTTSSEIVRRAYDVVGPFIVNDISAGEDDPQMLPLVAELGLTYVAMHKRGTPRTMDELTDYAGGIMRQLTNYFSVFSRLAESAGVHDWILDPGLGFAKTEAQNWTILQRLKVLQSFGRPILIGAADKRFTRDVPTRVLRWFGGKSAEAAREQCRVPGENASGTDIAHTLAVANGADILRVHTVPVLPSE